MNLEDPCPVCNNLALQPDNAVIEILPEALLLSSQHGCKLCRVLLAVVTASGVKISPDSVRLISVTLRLGYPLRIIVYAFTATYIDLGGVEG